ncbi:MAG: hypothetical protein V2A73_08685 [Pseudomonadota bacterium]
MVEKSPPGIVAFLDYKSARDSVTFAEVIAYNDLLSKAPVFLVIGDDPDSGAFEIRQYISGNWRPFPPDVTTVHVARCADWAEYSQWEDALRRRYRLTHG